MSSAESVLHPQEKTKAGPSVANAKRIGFGLGALFLIAAAVWGLIIGDGMQRFFHSYLVSFAYFLSFAVGALFFVILQHLVGAKWSITVRRTAECITQAFPFLMVASAVIWLPMLAGNDRLYTWSSQVFMETNHLVHKKAGYLNEAFFTIRILLYFVVWLALSRFFFKLSTQQDESGDPALSARMRKWSAPAMILFAFSVAFAGFDLLMSIEPEWFSTMFGVYYFAGAAISIMALLALVPMALQRSGRITRSVTTEHYHDVGKLLFAFVFFWGYVAFSQFMLIWAANIPEETGYFMKRWFSAEGEIGRWGVVTICLLLFHFLFPFVILMSRHTKRRLQALAAFAAWMLIWHWVDIYWQVMPALNNHHHSDIGAAVSPVFRYLPLDILVFAGLGLLFLGAVAHAMSKVHLVPVKDPGLAESLRFENQ